jgi:hypothetical protein
MVSLIYIKKYLNYKVYVKSVFIFGSIFLACMVISCNGNKSNTAKKAALKTGLPLKANPEDLHTLYLSAGGVDSLLNNATAKMIVFQFFIDTSDNSTLHAWPQHKDGSYKSGEAVLLKFASSDTTIVSGKDIDLGNVEIDSTACDTLSSKIKKFNYKTIYFVPRKDQTHIDYSIYGDTNANPQVVFVPNLENLIITLNPSPPRPANSL